MKNVLAVSMVLLVSLFAYSHEGKIIEGKKARTIVATLAMLSQEDQSIDYNDGFSQEGLDNDVVTDHWEIYSGQIGSQNFTCESHTFLKHKTSKKTDGSYKDSLECKKTLTN